MTEPLYPYQWELLAAMITYKVSGGLCLDYERLRLDDYKTIHDEKPTISAASLKQWFNGRAPAANALDDLCQYLANVFPYPDWHSFSEQESDVELMHICPNWKKYKLLKKAIPASAEFRKFQLVKHWAYGRVIKLARKNWQASGFHFLHRVDARIKEYEGSYQYFMPGQIPPVKYDDIYVDPLQIDEFGEVSFTNAFIKKEYTGQAIIKDKDNLQIVVFSKSEERKEGYEYVISIRLNNYGRTAEHFPGVVLGFSGERNIMAYPVLVTADMSLTKTHPYVVQYFEHCYAELKAKALTGRMECLTPLTVLEIFSGVHSFGNK